MRGYLNGTFQPVPSLDKGGGLVSGRASGHKNKCLNIPMMSTTKSMAPSTRQPLSGQGVLRITGGKVPNLAMVEGVCHSLSQDKTPKTEMKRLRFGTWNVGSLTGRSGEIAEALERRKVKVCCVQETRWKGEGSRMLRTKMGGKYKLFWKGCTEGVSGVGVIVSEEFINKVVGVERVNERIMMVKLIVGKSLMNVVSAYAPQVGRSQEEKDEFWDALCMLTEGVKKTERIMLGGDLNGHIGKDSDGYGGIHGGYGYGMRNAEGERILEFCEAMEMIVCGTQFRKAAHKLISYSSGGINTTVDYLMTRKQDRRCLKDAKALPGEEVVSLHRLLVCDLEVKGRTPTQQEKFKPRRKVWKLRNPVVRKRFEEILDPLNPKEDEEGDVNEAWERTRDGLLKATEEICGWTKGPARHIQTWWWNDEVGSIIEVKKAKFKEWQKAKGCPEEEMKLEEYGKAKKEAKKAVAKAQQQEKKKVWRETGY